MDLPVIFIASIPGTPAEAEANNSFVVTHSPDDDTAGAIAVFVKGERIAGACFDHSKPMSKGVAFTLIMGDRGELFVDGRLSTLDFEGDTYVKLNDQTGVTLGSLKLTYDEAADTLVF